MMRLRKLMTGLFCGLAFSALAADTAPLAIPATAAPKMDGTLDDPAWQNALKIEQLYLINSDQPVKDTAVYLARDKKWLYLGFKCVNSNMAHVAQTAFTHEGMVGADDSVEVFIKPESVNKRYYQFKLNFAGIKAEQRTSDAGMRDEGWTPPWRSVTKRLPAGWTAEIAIPLFVLECDDLSGMQINLCRNYMNIELDKMGAKQSEIIINHALKSGNKGSFHNFNNFLPVAGLGGFKPEIPFAPRITAAEVAGLQQKDGKYFYDVNLTLETASATAGTAKILVIEDIGAGAVEKSSELVELDGKRELVLSVPAGDLRERKVRVAIVDPTDGNLLAGMTIENLSALSVIKKAFVGRSYYTSEKAVAIRLELGLPDSRLKETLLVIDVNSGKVAEVKGLNPVMTTEIPLGTLKTGENALELNIISDGKKIASAQLVVRRLEPRPGFEVKTDFIKGIMLKNDKPVFPVGICTHSRGGKELFKYLSDVGFNLLVGSWEYKELAEFMRLTETYGMNVFAWTSPQPAPIGMKPGTWPPPPVTQPLAERLAFQKEWYSKLEPGIIEETKLFRDRKNMLGYWNVDEPNLVNADERIAVAEWYRNTVNSVDPYRSQFLLYSMNIPNGDNWTRWGDILGYDIYPRPFMPNFMGESGSYTAYYAYELRERCRQDNKVMFFVPLAGDLGGPRSPIGMSKAHMLCQAYTAVIYGSRGLLYFCLGTVIGEEAWDALRTINAQIKEMAPALLNGDIAQHIKYTPDNFRPKERKFPMVNAAIFQYPDGDYLLLAVNIIPFAVDTKIQIGGMKKATRLFDSRGKMKLDGESFTDKIEPYGVRAYNIKLADKPAAVQVALDMTAVEDEKAESVDIPGIVRQVMLGKNYVPNPCFKQQFNKGIPDFFQPYFCLGFDPSAGKNGSTWFVDNETLWNGNPSLRVFRDKDGPEMTRGAWGLWYPPALDKPTKMTFSFYAKCDKTNQNLFVRMFGDKSVPLTSTDWKRYSLTGDVSPGDNSNLGGRGFLICFPVGATTWITAFQMEAGETATEFQDDSVRATKK